MDAGQNFPCENSKSMCYNINSNLNKGVRKIIKILICDDSITVRKKLQGAITVISDIEFAGVIIFVGEIIFGAMIT